ncbi:GrpB family protein [Mangrovivirga sp. M17]|uniref:GrpB family protein n=1 Tax=Mangrovivirga halotolerans TaxID=2993936 RepID=A0ABT3RNE5_9BACT|nr:GrpB family protein [Mangrovivirga halotolerans]MCX2743299.1 GrpB family protein [Mangrovivirga halotolerans]
MRKEIQNLTKQDWDTLFPIELADHNSVWKDIFESEKQDIVKQAGEKIIGIEHVGSTSIPGIKAKSYIDISIEIAEEDLFDQDIIGSLNNLGYHYFRQSSKIDYMIFVKGYNLSGENDQVFHLHICPTDHPMLDQIAFRDFLIDNHGRAKAYEQLKIELAEKYRNDRSGYRIAKDDFIKETMDMIRNEKS